MNKELFKIVFKRQSIISILREKYPNGKWSYNRRCHFWENEKEKITCYWTWSMDNEISSLYCYFSGDKFPELII